MTTAMTTGAMATAAVKAAPVVKDDGRVRPLNQA